MDRSLTYFDDVAAIKVSLQLIQKRSGVPLLQFTSTLKLLHSRPFTPRTDIQAGCEAYVTSIRSSPSLCEEPLGFTREINQLLGCGGRIR